MVLTSAPHLDVEPGPVLRTDRPADFALSEAGYVHAQAPSGKQVLLRTASLVRGPDGVLSDQRGNVLMGTDGFEIPLVQDVPIRLTTDGAVYQGEQRVGALRFLQVGDESSLERLGGGAYAVTDTSGPAYDQANTLAVGYLEGSNVKPLESMVKMIELERGYQATMKVIQAYREADEALIERTSQ